MGNTIRERVSSNLRHPQAGFVGWVVINSIKSQNRGYELNAVRLCKLQFGHTALEIGFGPGVGLEEACKTLEGGPGKVYGIDYSEVIVRNASSRLASYISSGKLEIIHGSVENLPFEDNFFDRVFHCNCYYFWPDLNEQCAEIYRVMKPGGLMVTTLRRETLAKNADRGLVTHEGIDHDRYMEALKGAGFSNVKMEEMPSDDDFQNYQAIFAEKL